VQVDGELDEKIGYFGGQDRPRRNRGFSVRPGDRQEPIRAFPARGFPELIQQWFKPKASLV
jgi:hypothetical protein